MVVQPGAVCPDPDEGQVPQAVLGGEEEGVHSGGAEQRAGLHSSGKGDNYTLWREIVLKAKNV